MAMRPWIFISNTFYINTVESFKNALILSNDHVSKLIANEADAEILAIKAAYLPLHNGFLTVQNQLNSKLGIYHGQTQTFEEILEELASEKINEWRGTVFAVFPERSAGAKAIFPRDREPFQSDTYDQRVEAVESLSITLATYTMHPTLVTLSGTVHTYHLMLTGARALQQTDEGSVDTLRSNLRVAHKIMCVGLHRNFALLLAKFIETPERVIDYFDLTLLRKTGEDETSASGTIPAGTVKSLIGYQEPGFNYSPDTIVRLKNTSTNGANMIVFPSNTETDPPGAGTQYMVPAGGYIDKTFAELGSVTFLFLCIQNINAMEVSWQIEIQ
ncbi:MAG: hypothetical protein V4615_16645 [Bacteroidota bacterium]